MKLLVSLVGLFGLVCWSTVFSFPTDKVPVNAFQVKLAKLIENHSGLSRFGPNNTRITSGNVVGTSEAQWQVALIRGGNFICGGVLTNSKTVVTAAHCIHGFENNPHELQIRYNTIYYNSGPTIDIIKINRHPLYNAANMDYDIATLFLDKPVSADVNSIKLAQFEPPTSARVYFYGWGSASSETLQSRLLYGTASIVYQSSCKSYWDGVNEITERMICGSSGSYSLCNGDGGGPVVYNSQLVGILSFGYPCSSSNYPNVYTDTVVLRNWIVSNQQT